MKKKAATKRRKKIRKNKELTKNWLTIYIKNHNPLKEWTDSRKSIAIVPELQDASSTKKNDIFQCMTIHEISRKDVNLLDNIKKEKFNEVLQKLSLSKKRINFFNHDKYPVRFSIVDGEVFDKLDTMLPNVTLNTNAENPFYWNFSNLPNTSIPGIVVSMWDCVPPIKDLFPRNHYKSMQDRFGKAFGSRKSVPSGAFNCYLGPCNSKRPKHNPSYGEERREHVDYDRNYYSFAHMHVPLQNSINHSARLILQHVKNINDEYMSFVGYDTCTRAIWTQGISKRSDSKVDGDDRIIKKDNLKTSPHDGIGFYNKPHIDINDIVPDDIYLKWFNKLNIDASTQEYIETIKEKIGVGLPTTCGYNFSQPNQDSTIFAHFLCWDFLTSITDHTFHHFYGWSFPHCTTVPMQLTDNIVRVTNSNIPLDKCIYVGAWGRSGGSPEARKRNITS